MAKKISIVTPVYNGKKFIKQTIESVLSQAQVGTTGELTDAVTQELDRLATLESKIRQGGLSGSNSTKEDNLGYNEFSAPQMSGWWAAAAVFLVAIGFTMLWWKSRDHKPEASKPVPNS